MIKCISIAKDFNENPAGRFSSDGPYSGEQFREQLLLPAIMDAQNETVEVDLNNLGGVGSSFWDEAFGGLIRENNVTQEEIQSKLVLICADPSIVRLVWDFINAALGEKDGRK